MAAAQPAFGAFHNDGQTSIPNVGSIEFVPSTQPGQPFSQSTRRLIKKHAMKEIGRARRRLGRRGEAVYLVRSPPVASAPLLRSNPQTGPYSRPGQAIIDPDTRKEEHVGVERSRTMTINDQSSHKSAEQQAMMHQLSAPGPISRFDASRIDRFKDYPINMNMDIYGLVDHLYDNSIGKFRSFREIWFPVALGDPAAFHQLMANSSLDISLLRGSRDLNVESAVHHAVAIRSVNERLTDPTLGQTDGMLSAVAAFSCYYLMTGKFNHWNTHMAGLQKMVELRGGMEAIKSNQLLRLVILWVDMGGCSAQDIAPHFTLSQDLVPSFEFSPSPPAELKRSRTLWQAAFTKQSPITDALQKLSALATLIQKQSSTLHFWEDPMFVGMTLNPLISIFLSLPRPADSSLASIMYESSRLAALLYIDEVRRKFHLCSLATDRYLANLTSTLANLRPGGWPRSFEVLRLWILVLACISYHWSKTADSPAWFEREISQLSRTLRLRSLGDMWMAFSNLQLPWNAEVFAVRYGCLENLVG